ncbi:TPA: hypothetical protein HA318_03260 [Candidatus Micrarchaeota archaeon]|nr:MAG: hypothetical protein AUJ65_04505 [Candidatus Micrarchaeota archaeon CG1_02_51_15]HII38994.1 hypothetical protein [Candidatus Micrarchaeota archaeon]
MALFKDSKLELWRKNWNAQIARQGRSPKNPPAPSAVTEIGRALVGWGKMVLRDPVTGGVYLIAGQIPFLPDSVARKAAKLVTGRELRAPEEDATSSLLMKRLAVARAAGFKTSGLEAALQNRLQETGRVAEPMRPINESRIPGRTRFVIPSFQLQRMMAMKRGVGMAERPREAIPQFGKRPEVNRAAFKFSSKERPVFGRPVEKERLAKPMPKLAAPRPKVPLIGKAARLAWRMRRR